MKEYGACLAYKQFCNIYIISQAYLHYWLKVLHGDSYTCVFAVGYGLTPTYMVVSATRK